MPQATPRPAGPATPARPPASTPAPPVTAGSEIVALQTQLADLNVQATALRAQLRGLNRQLNSMRIDNPARPGVQQQAADVGVQVAQVEGRIAQTQARLAQLQGVSADRIGPAGQLVPPSNLPGFRRGPDPDMVVGMSFVVAMCFVLPLSIGFARRIWRGTPQPAGPRTDEIAPRLDRLEQAVDAIAIEVERISEGQRFVTRILAERPAAEAQAKAAEGVAAEKPVLALGAGAVEPIRVGERQAVRQSNTPR